jgi:hypothetical protein
MEDCHEYQHPCTCPHRTESASLRILGQRHADGYSRGVRYGASMGADLPV